MTFRAIFILFLNKLYKVLKLYIKIRYIFIIFIKITSIYWKCSLKKMKILLLIDFLNQRKSAGERKGIEPLPFENVPRKCVEPTRL